MEKELNDLKELFSLFSDNLSYQEKLDKEINKLDALIEKFEKETFLSGKYDSYPAILSIQSGAGGRDAEDCAVLLLRMYEKFADKKGWNYRILSKSVSEGGGPEGRVGIREVSLEINGKFAYGLLKNESGVHRFVRISPFSAKSLRHTSFVGVEVIPDIKEEEVDIKIDPDDLKIETFHSSGHGGQNVNKRETAVRIVHLPTNIAVSCQVERLQQSNRKRAMQILKAKLLRLEERKKEEEIKKIKGKRQSAEFGNQIRSYVFHPYKLVKDVRTGVETSDIDSVLDGEIDSFIDAEIKL